MGYDTKVGSLPDMLATVRRGQMYDPQKAVEPSGRSVLKGGMVVDPANGIEDVKDIAFQGQYIVEVADEIKPEPGDLICPKNRYDGFYGTWLEHFLGRVWHVENLVIVGTVANICVLHTAASAGLRWYRVIVPADGVSALTDFDQALTLRQVSWLYAGSVVKSVAGVEFVPPPSP